MNEKLNKLVILYQSTKCDEVFTDAYEILRSKLLTSKNWRGIDDSDLLEIFDESVLATLETYEESKGHVIHYAATVFKRRQLDHMKRQRTRRKYEHHYEDIECELAGTESFIEEIADDFSLESDIVRKEEIAEVMQFVNDPGKVTDEVTRKITAEILKHQPTECRSVGRPKSICELIAPKVGASSKTVRRKLQRLGESMRINGLAPEYL